ncbi:MAG: hypothetical protein IKJ62_04435 [Alphaproteobacteria bacterium]|nr:hypothetical protein [Alphaproteobacteria bacterium]
MNQESGRSMIEMLGVLAIMGALTVGAYALIKDAFESQRQMQGVEEVFVIVNEVRKIHSQYDDFSNMDGEVILNMMEKKHNPYGGTYELTVNPANSRQFILTINGLSKSECQALITRAWTDSVGYKLSDKKESGATGSCDGTGDTNYVQITYGE